MTTGDNGRDDKETDRKREGNVYTCFIIYTRIKTIAHKKL